MAEGKSPCAAFWVGVRVPAAPPVKMIFTPPIIWGTPEVSNRMEESKESNESNRSWIRTGEAADLLGISKNTLKRLVREGLLKAYRVKGVTGLQFRRQDVLALLEEVTPEDMDVIELDGGNDEE